MTELERAQNAPWFLDPYQFKQPLMLDIGAGGYSSDDKFTSVDLFTACDIKSTMWEIPLPDESVEVIYSSNALEHVSKNDILPTIREWHRLLKVGGKLQLIVPDLEWSCRWWLDHQDTDWSMDIIYGHQKHEGEFHKTGFTPNIMLDYLQKSGYTWTINKIEYLDAGAPITEDLGDGTYKWVVAQRMVNLEALKGF